MPLLILASVLALHGATRTISAHRRSYRTDQAPSVNVKTPIFLKRCFEIPQVAWPLTHLDMQDRITKFGPIVPFVLIRPQMDFGRPSPFPSRSIGLLLQLHRCSGRSGFVLGCQIVDGVGTLRVVLAVAFFAFAVIAITVERGDGSLVVEMQ